MVQRRQKKAAKKAVFIAKCIDAEIVAMYVIDKSLLSKFPAEIMPSSVNEILRKEGFSYINEVEKMGKRMGVKVIKKVIEGIPDEEIIKEAKKDDLIIMGSKGTTALDRILLGSVAEKVVRHAPCSVMVCK